MNANPYASTSSATTHSLDSPLIRTGWRHWLLRLLVISWLIGAVHIALVWLDRLEVLPWRELLRPGAAIPVSLPALVLGLTFRGFRSTRRSAFPATFLRYSAAIVLLQILMVAMKWEVVSPMMTGRPYIYHNGVRFLLTLSMMVLLFTFVSRSWGETLNWTAIGSAVVAVWGFWTAIEYFVFVPAFDALSPREDLQFDLTAFLHRSSWSFCLGLFLPLVVRGEHLTDAESSSA